MTIKTSDDATGKDLRRDPVRPVPNYPMGDDCGKGMNSQPGRGSEEPGALLTEVTLCGCHAPCGCKLVQCDPCGRMVPRGETLYLSPEQSGAAQCDTTACTRCRGADPEDVHPTCEHCGSCQACACETPEGRLARVERQRDDALKLVLTLQKVIASHVTLRERLIETIVELRMRVDSLERLRDASTRAIWRMLETVQGGRRRTRPITVEEARANAQEG